MNEANHDTGLCLILSAPSGGGKTTVIRALMERFAHLQHSISYTTRSPRPDRTDLYDYHFITGEQFDVLLDDSEFLEWAVVHGNKYGTRRRDLMDLLERGYDVVLDIDVQGARQMRSKIPDGVFIFVMPPSFDVLENRLRARASDREDVIEKRLRNAKVEIQSAIEYDYIVVNDDLEKTIDVIGAIIKAEKTKTQRVVKSISWAIPKEKE